MFVRLRHSFSIEGRFQVQYQFEKKLFFLENKLIEKEIILKIFLYAPPKYFGR